MPGERLAKITLRATVTHQDVVRGIQTQHLTFYLGSQQVDVYRGGQPGEFIVPDPDDATVGEQYGLVAMQHMLAALSSKLFAQQLPFAASTPVQVGTTSTFYDTDKPAVIIEFSLQATGYSTGRTIGFDPHFIDPYLPTGWVIVSQVSNVSPVFATYTVQDAGIYGAADGAITIVPSGGDGGFYQCQWADGTYGASRQGLAAGTYPVKVSDAGTGAYIQLNIVVGSDARLDVQVQQVANNVHLVVSGGVGPYTYAWLDGPTTPDRTGLAAGFYSCTVTDSHGASTTVTLTVSAYNLFYWSRNPVTLSLTAQNLAGKPNLRFFCEVWLEEEYLSGVFTNIAGVLTQPADRAGQTTFDVSTLLDAYVAPDFPAHGESGLRRADGMFRRFYLQHSEQWDGSGAPTYIVRETHYLVYGGLDFFEYATQSYFTVYRPHVHPFLTWEPTQKEVFADQPEYLYYHHDSLVNDYFGVQVRFTTAGGTTSTVLLGSQTGVACFEVWRVGVGLPQLRTVLGNAVPADVVAWDVTAVDVASLPLTETRYYQLSEELPANRRYFLFASSVGGINTLACRGKAKTDLTLTSTLVQRSLQPTYPADAGETFTTNVAGVPTLSVNTGYLNPAQVEALRDFLLSEEIRYVDTDRYRPGSLQPADTLPLGDDDAGLVSVEFLFVLPTLRRYTPTLPLHY